MTVLLVCSYTLETSDIMTLSHWDQLASLLSLFLAALISLDYHYKILCGLNNRNLFLTSWEFLDQGASKVGIILKWLLLTCTQLPSPCTHMTSSLNTRRERKKAPWYLFLIRVLIPPVLRPTLMVSCNPNHLKAPSPDTIIPGVRTSTDGKWTGHTYSVHRLIYHRSPYLYISWATRAENQGIKEKGTSSEEVVEYCRVDGIGDTIREL